MKAYINYILILSGLLVSLKVFAVTGVNPTGVNVRHNGSSTVFLTFRDLDPNEVSTEAFWCGEVTATGVSTTNPCVAGTIFGNLPIRSNRSQVSNAGAFKNLTDIMTIPASVARRAFQSAISGNNSDFFYVRRFTGGLGGDRFVTVTCRMAGGGARSPLALLDVKVGFMNDKGAKDPIYLVERGKQPSKFSAMILYNGTGRLKGRWEVKLPGDPEPTSSDLLTEATLPVEKRGLQRRYTVLGSFDIFLTPTGKVLLPGPDASKIPNDIDGLYKILLRIEATRDKEGNSNTGAGTVVSGGVAGFPMPVLRYYVGTSKTLKSVREKILINELLLMLPQDEVKISATEKIEFSWVGVNGAKFYNLEVMENNILLTSAILKSGQESYSPPPTLFNSEMTNVKWSVTAMDSEGDVIARSKVRRLLIK